MGGVALVELVKTEMIFFGGLFVFIPISYESPTGAAPTLFEWSMGGRRKTPISMPAITAT